MSLSHGGHGTELIQLSFSREDSSDVIFKATKITGDPNEPAGQQTFKGSLNGGLIMPMDEQVLNYPSIVKVTMFTICV